MSMDSDLLKTSHPMPMERPNQILKYTTKPSNDREMLSEKEYMEMVSLHGKENVDNDLVVDLMVLYPQQTGVIDAEGREVTISEQELYDIAKASNLSLVDRIKNAYHKGKSYLTGKHQDNYDYVTIQLDHDLDMEKRQGYTIGKFSIKKHNGMPYLHTQARIMNYMGKINIKKGLYREISATVRIDNTLKEISFVSSPALKYASVLSEPQFKTQVAKVPDFTRLQEEFNTTQKLIKETRNKLKLAERTKNITFELNNLLKCGKIYPRDVDFYRNRLLKMDDKNAQASLTLLQLAEPVIKLHHVDVRNRNFFEGAVMHEDFNKVMDDLDKGNIRLQDLQKSSQLKGMFSEVLTTTGDDAKDDANKVTSNKEAAGVPSDPLKMGQPEGGLAENIKLGEFTKELRLKLMAMLEEGDTEGCKKILSEIGKPAQDPNETDGDLPDNAKLSEDVKKLKSKLSEYEKKQDKIMKKIGNVNENIKAFVSAVQGKGQ